MLQRGGGFRRSRGIERFPLFDCAYGGPASEVHHNQIGFFLWLLQEFGYGAENERVADAVEAVLA